MNQELQAILDLVYVPPLVVKEMAMKDVKTYYCDEGILVYRGEDLVMHVSAATYMKRLGL